MRTEYSAPDISTESALRQAGATEQSFVEFTSIRTVSGSADASFSFGVRASRPSSGAQGDRYFATDRNWLYYYTGTAWAIVTGLMFGTDAARAAITPDAADNGAAFYTTDTNKLWRVSGGAWVDSFVSIDVTTSYEVGGTKVIGARETGWTAATGTANKGAFATYAGQDVSAAYVEAEAQATDDATKADSQRIKAIEDCLRTHGLLGA
jgi:hypothetical protein